MSPQPELPNPKLCECGCGLPAPIAPRSIAKLGHVKGEPIRFIRGHNGRKPDLVAPNPSGLCMCGCGQKTRIAAKTETQFGWVAGHPTPFVNHVHARRSRAAERFWARVNKRGPNECWEWQDFRDEKGYGRVGHNGKVHPAHRVAYLLHYGSIADKELVCHECDNPPCCNPAHLWQGTTLDNTRDMISKGRARYFHGEQHPRAKFTNEQVREFRRQHAETGINAAALARLNNACEGTMQNILMFRSYQDA